MRHDEGYHRHLEMRIQRSVDALPTAPCLADVKTFQKTLCLARFAAVQHQSHTWDPKAVPAVKDLVKWLRPNLNILRKLPSFRSYQTRLEEVEAVLAE